ncbi:A disintegrin and metalloproteinase with thrombospondin motifs 20 isoform X8 [Physeter macrocephalus]|uniref:A disintegrin and metalloproteinase with thrombospondin motifs 20 isoform X8 n=1 Tax=Physeter macrocephalus TaxID=9755 RepID=A0A455BH52_PHYMC|nr:A disintegrin and metalloproteinase with thrombospondin motifs 20 isoform X8 [Physeter catodon]|eukprot:XP_028347238.1 A disintegrin and metalloproteinase with thrombospondin motifs 20 isoform X8 [Physeter catodon]
MRVAKWLTGLLYQLSLFITKSWEVHFHPRQEALVRTLASYEVVTPARVNEFGEVFPKSHHFSRRKRSAEALEPTPFRTHYRIRAYGQVFQLNLSADAAFLAAGYTEVHLGAPALQAEERRTAPPDLRHCFYRGQVNAREDHTAVFSLCGGLMGTFKAHDGEYFLEPIMKADGSEHEDDHNKPHLIYRQELKRNYFLQSHKPCEVSESQIKKTTLPFHNYSDMNEDLNIKGEIVLGDSSKNISLEDERSQLHSRKKRFLSYPRYVEVMVTADAKMVHHHGQNLQHYVLTLMSIVAAIYKDSSIGNLINIVIVKLVVIHDEQEGPVISFNAATTLHNFCLWQQTQNVLDDAHPSHHDTAVLITREDICGAREKCDTLALSDTQGNFLLNGNFVVSMSKKEINVQGAIFEYSGSNNSIERINSTDRLEEELLLQVLCVGNLYNPDVRYSFNIPMEEKSDLFTWDPYGPWQDCTKMCQGLHRRKITCVRKSDHMVASDQRCDHLPLPLLVTERCNTDCELRWHIIGKSECSSLCGRGYKSLDIHCMKYSIHKGHTVPVDDHYCGDQLKPPTREPCHGDCVLTRWHYSEWSQCSRSCGGGERSRESYCINNFGHRLADRECQELPRVTTENCNEFSCPSWATSEWSECLVTCGKGTRQRQVWCQLNEDHLSDGFCDPSNKPESLRPCELHACASWQVGPWGSCTATCGQGYQMRAVKCVNELLSAVLDDRLCHGASRPSDRQDCIVTPCPIIPKIGATSLPALPMGKIAQWRYGSWTPCSVSCGRGNQARYVSCRDAHDGIADESYCAHLPRPAEIAVCFSPCGEWQAGNWSPCSASCGHGKTTRQVLCISYHQPINENYCDPEVRPVIEQECNLAACPPTYSHFPSSSEQPSHFPGRNFPLTHKPEDNQNQGVHPSIRGNQWRTGPWGSCSSSCAGGIQRRVVVCQDENGRSASYCNAASKPPESKHCDSGPCPRWSYGSWGECTQTCGGGIKSRFVICQFPNGQMSREQNCEILNKPPSVVQCHVHACPDDVSWHRGPWKSCSAPCGKGLKYREVICVDQFHGKLEEKYCSHLQKPRTHKACRSVRCPSWKAKRWKECSVTCGSGVQQRDVYCRLRGVGRVAEEKCDQSTRPYFQRQCWRQDCIQYHWVAGEWLDCSTSCKKRETHRQVKCVGAQNMQVNESFCDPSTRPLAIRKCRNPPCKYIVVTGDSSQCAGNCGFSYGQRITYCIEIRSTEKYKLHELWPTDYQECPVLPSPQVYKCNFRTCLHMATWKVGKWSKCSVTCGVGIMERRVECIADNGWSSDLCLKSLKPDAQKKCYVHDCKTFTSCKEIQVKNNITKDGDYYLNIKGRIIKIYCAGMHLQNPKEYISLVKGEEDNFSEVYGFRLQNPYECPFNGSRRQDCECKNDCLAAGHTVFSKIRIDLNSMQIKTTDLLFAQTVFGNAVPFATAGDCYSAARCPQGQFSINLAGTGMKISSTAKWLAQGSYASVIIHRSQDGTKVYGRCGGFCGKCIPHMTTGLPIQGTHQGVTSPLNFSRPSK